MKRRRGRSPVHILGLVLIGVGIGFIVFALRNDDTSPKAPAFSDASLALSTPTATTEPTVTSEVAEAIYRIQIPRIEVNASTIRLGLDADGNMLSPKEPMVVAWYTFSANPGQRGNIVLAGHVDYINFGPAVFWRLRELRPGDDVILEVDEGKVFTYRVTSVSTYNADSAPIQEIVGPTDSEVVTLITCTGAFNRAQLEYADRLVVRAERVVSPGS